VNPTHVRSTAQSEGGAPPPVAPTDNALPRTRVVGQSGPTTVTPGPEVAAQRSRWTAGRVTALVIGVLLVLFSLPLVGGGGTALWADLTQREDGYVTTGVHEFSTSGSALATVPTELGSAGFGWLYSPSLLGTVRIRATPVNSDAPLFVGIGPATDVDRYLAGVSHTVITEFWEDEVEAVGGGTPQSDPGTQDFWVASDTGPGALTLVWEPTDGSWTVVVMNADGRPGIDVGADLGAKMPALVWVAVGVVVAGTTLLVGGALLIAGAIRRRAASSQ
jgi:hypothetical protein